MLLQVIKITIMELVKITNDLFDVAWRLKAIRESYVVYYNVQLHRYEVHDSAQYGNTLAFVVPYGNLDCRTVDYALKTRVQNANEIFDGIERANARQDKLNCDAAVCQAAQQFM